MTKKEKIEEIKQRARKNFSLGYNCAEGVTEAVLSLVDTGLPEDVKKLATGFGGESQTGMHLRLDALLGHVRLSNIGSYPGGAAQPESPGTIR